MERIEFDLLFRWFVALGVDDTVWDHSTSSKNRHRLLAGGYRCPFWPLRVRASSGASMHKSAYSVIDTGQLRSLRRLPANG